MSSHHKTLSPSSFPAKSKCIHYQSKSSVGLPAHKGTILHKHFENYLLGLEFNDQDKGNLISEGVEERAFAEVSHEDIEKIRDSIDFIEEYIQEEEPGFDIRKAIREEQAFPERRMTIYNDSLDELTFGTLDFSYKHFICDLKTGKVRDYKPQMAAYALSVFQDNPLLEKLVIIELYSDIGHMKIYSMSLEEAEGIVFGIAEKLKEKEKHAKKMNDYCTWCENCFSCEEVLESLTTLAKARFFPKQLVSP